MNDWHLVNLLVPPLLPLLLPSLISMFHLSKQQKIKASPIVAIKDGQMAWAGLGMCVNAFYDFRHPAKGVVLAESWSNLMFWSLIVALIVLTSMASMAPIFPTPSARPAGKWAALVHYRVMVGSIVLTIAAAWLYAEVHFTTQT